MRRHSSLIPLSQDHHHGLVLAQLIKKGAPLYKQLPKTLSEKVKYTQNFYKDDLTYHFYEEENILYPVLKKKDKEIDKIFSEIFEEHKRIIELIKSLPSAEKQEDILDELGYLLESHIRKEERNLFPKIQSIFSDEELDELNNRVINSRKKRQLKSFSFNPPDNISPGS